MLNFAGEIRDPIHGLIPLIKLESEIIDTRAFQRLRNIRQLALAHLVFPGTQHTRFEHSIGVMHVAWKIAEHLRSRERVDLSDHDVQNIRLAGLLHDIGHGPFSHISEDLLELHSDTQDKTGEIHEELSRRIIEGNEGIVDLLGEQRASDVAELLSTERAQRDYRHEIVSGPLDADKMDYLLRDSYYSGVAYGIFDLERLINVLTVTSERLGRRLAVRYEGIETAEQYVLAKYFISQQVYQHRIRRITDLMIVEGVNEAISNGNEKLKKLYSYDDDPNFINLYLKFDDVELTNELLKWSENHGESSDYFGMLKRRHLLKELFLDRLERVAKGYAEDTFKVNEIRKGGSIELAGKISQLLNLNPRLTHIRVYSLKAPSPYRTDSVFDKESILVKMPEGLTSSLYDESLLFPSLTKNAQSVRISVFGIPEKESVLNEKVKVQKVIEEELRKYFGGNYV